MFECTGTQGRTDKEAVDSRQSLFYDGVRNVDKSEVTTRVSGRSFTLNTLGLRLTCHMTRLYLAVAARTPLQ